MKLILENWREYLTEGHKYHWHSSPPSEEIQGVIDANTANVKCRMGELACQDMSYEWAKVFRDAGFDVEIHHGTYKEEGHSWIEVDGHLFDPTAGQFKEIPNYSLAKCDTKEKASASRYMMRRKDPYGGTTPTQRTLNVLSRMDDGE